MIILNCDQHRNLSFVDKKYRILQGEHKFDVIKINMPESIDGVDDMQGVSIKMHFVSNNEHIDRQVVLENGHISTDIDYTLTEKSKRWLLYLAFYVNVDGEVEIGKTNAIAIQVNKLPYSDTLAKEYKEPEIVLIKGDKGDKGDPGEDGKSAYEIAVEHGYEGTEEEWLSEMKDYNELDNKPQINGHTLSGNQSIDDLNLQGKLTAGNNITIEGNVISAEGGGVTDYNELDNKPQINGITLSGNKSATDLELKEIFFGISNPPQDSYTKYPSNALWVNLNENTQFVLTATDDSSSSPWFNWKRINNRVIQSTESAPKYSGINVKYPYDKGDLWLQVDSGKITKISVCTGMGRHSVDYKTWRYFYYWAEFTGGGSQIVSGVVNVNGTITFTDSEGNSFTTSGESVIGPQGAPGKDYVLTNQDKTDIANIVLSELPTTEGVLYGN